MSMIHPATASIARACLETAGAVFAWWLVEPIRRYRLVYKAKQRGAKDRRAGVPVSANPYSTLVDRDAWLRGWSGRLR